MSDAVIITAMILGTILTLAFFFGILGFRDHEKDQTGAFALEKEKNRVKAEILRHDIQLKLGPAKEKPPERVDAELVDEKQEAL